MIISMFFRTKLKVLTWIISWYFLVSFSYCFSNLYELRSNSVEFDKIFLFFFIFFIYFFSFYEVSFVICHFCTTK